MRMALVLPWQPNETCSVVIRHLAQGKCVVLPTEATYELVGSALHPESVAILGTNPDPAVVLFDYAELFDWMRLLGGAAVRMFRKLGPGPLQVRANGGYSNGVWARLPADAQRLTATDGLLRVRWPAHPVWNEVRQAGLPLLSTPLAAVTAAEAAALVDGNAACVVDAGPTQYAGLPTIVRIDGACVVERPGILTQEQIDELALCRILFICTGNTCRSPLAETLCAKLLADHWGRPAAELKQLGFCVQSAGLAAMMGNRASAEAVTAASDLGVDLSQHKSAMVTMDMLVWADHLLGMTAGHCYTLESILGEGMTPPRPLSPTFEDISDPIGGALADYRTCATQILACLRARLPEWLES